MTDTNTSPADTKTAPPDANANAELEHEAVTNTSASSERGFLKRAFSAPNRQTTKRFFSAYAQTWLGLAPLWLMSEAILPNRKVGSQFHKGRKELMTAATEVREMVATSGKDVVVIIDEKLKSSGGSGREAAQRTTEVIKAAGENAILVVTSSLSKLSSSSSGAKSTLHTFAHSPEVKQKLQRHSRDAVILLDKSLKHPVVVTGVSGFARSRGIPYADALLRLASLGLNKILKAMPVPADVQEHAEAKIEEIEIEEIDAEDLERRSTQEEREEAVSIGKAADNAPTPRISGEGHPEASTSAKKNDGGDRDPYAKMKKQNDCIVM